MKNYSIHLKYITCWQNKAIKNVAYYENKLRNTLLGDIHRKTKYTLYSSKNFTQESIVWGKYTLTLKSYLFCNNILI